MSGVLNDCDAILQAAPVRLIPSNGDAAAALAAAEAAQDSADTANTSIADMARDDLLSPVEKPAENLRWNTIVGECPGIDSAAGALGITTERTAYTNAYNTLNTYIGGLGAGFSTIPGAAIAIVGATYRTNFKSYYDAKQAVLNKIAAVSATKADANSITGLNSFRIVAKGFFATNAGTSAGRGFYKNGVIQYGVTRNYMLVVIRRSDATIIWTRMYDIWANAGEAANLVTDLNNATADHIVVVYSEDNPAANRFANNLATAMYRCGASRAIFGSSEFKNCSAYCLVGVPGCGEGNGAEFYQGSIDNDPNAWVDVAFTLVNGNYTAMAGYTPRSLKDYGYNGDMNATAGAPAGTNVGNTPATTVESQAAAAIPKKTMAVSITGTLLTTVGSGTQTYGTQIATVTGNFKAPLSYRWSCTGESDNGIATINYFVSGDASADRVGLKGTATNMRILGQVSVDVTDADGITVRASRGHQPTHGSYIPQ